MAVLAGAATRCTDGRPVAASAGPATVGTDGRPIGRLVGRVGDAAAGVGGPLGRVEELHGVGDELDSKPALAVPAGPFRQRSGPWADDPPPDKLER